jgi:hypothetical protein
MTQTVQALERYTALERELIERLPTEKLVHLQDQCVEVAKALRADELRRLLPFGLACLATAAMCFWGFNEGICIMVIAAWGLFPLICLDDARQNGFGLVFALGNGETFSVHEWNQKADDTPRLRFWQEVRDGLHGPFEVSAMRLKFSQKVAMMFAYGNGGRIVFGKLLGYASSVFVLTMLGGVMFSGGKAAIIAIVLGVGCILTYLRGTRIAWLPPEKLDPAAVSVGQAYRAIVQVLDARGPERGQRRSR